MIHFVEFCLLIKLICSMKTRFFILSAAFFLLMIPFSKANNGFVPNMGQIVDETGTVRPDVLFTYELPGAKMFFQKDHIVFVFWKFDFVENEESRELYEKGDIEGAKFQSMRIHQMRIDMGFEGANATGEISYDKKLSNYVNFYHGHCPDGIRNVSVYQNVTYHNVWEHIDIVFQANESGLKYDLVLRPGAKLSDVKFRYKGIKKLSMSDGSLNVENVFIPLTEHIPLSYFSETTQEVKVNFSLIDETTYGFYSEELGNDIIKKEVIIDPTLSWSTYFERTVAGGVSTIRGNNITDDEGNYFYQINSYTADLPIVNPGIPAYFDPSYNPTSGMDIYFAKFDINRELIWSTYLGGTGNQKNYYDHGLGTWNGYFFISGDTDSNNFPLKNQGGGAYYQTYPGKKCGFLSKFDATTGEMIHSTYLHSYENHCMDVDNLGNIAVISFNYDWTVTPTILNRTGAYNQATHGGDSDLFLYMFNSSMQQTWGTYFGGAGYTDPMGIAFDNNRNLFIYSRTSTNTGMPLYNPGGGAFYQSTINGSYDCGISKFNTSGALVWSTYFGGAGLEGLSYSKARVNETNDVILTTTTRSTVMPVYNQGGGAYYQGTPPVGLNNGMGGDPGAGFYIRFNNNGVRQHATYVGVDNEDNYIHDQVQGNCDRQYLILQTKAFPTTILAGSYNQSNTNPPSVNNYMAIEFDQNFAIRWSTYLQPDSTFFEQCAIDKQNGRLYIMGSTRATDYITANPGGGAFFDGVKNMATPNQWVMAIMEFDIGAPPNVWVSGGGNPEICGGGNITFNASGSGTIYWYDQQTGGNLLGTGTNYTLNNVTSTTTVWVESNDDGCASARVPITVTVIPAPSVTLTASQNSICQNTPVTLTGGGANNYSWSGSLGTGNPKTVTPTSNTTYTVTGTDGNGCTASASILINVNANPVVGINATSTTICDGQSVTLTGTGASNYSWNNGLGTGNPKIVTPTSNTTYTVTGTDGNGCTASTSTLINVNANPVVGINATATTICDGENVTLTGTGASNYSWSGSLGSGNPKIVSPSTNTSYTVTGTDANNCSASAQVTINVSSSFDATINPVGTVCSNDPAFNLTAANGSGVWSGPGITNTNTGLFNPTFAGAGNHEIIYTIYGSCGDADTTIIVVLQAPSVTLVADDNSICMGNDISLTAGGADTYIWFPSGTGNSNTFTPGTTTTYSVTGTSGSCSNTASVTVTVLDLPNVTLIAGDDELCQGETTSLTANGANTYLWSNSGSGNPINVSPTSTTTYTVTGTDGNFCSASANITITVYDSPTVTISASQSTICEGEPVVISAGGADSYQWSPSGTGTETTFYPTSTTTYTVTGTNSFNCSASASITITVSPPADATIITTGPFCSADDPVVMNAVTSGGTWAGPGITNSNSGIFDPSVAGTGLHTISYTIPGTCGDSDAIEILVNESPDILISATPISCDGASDGILSLHVDMGLPPYTISWNNGSSDTLLSNLSSGNYSVVVIDNNSCSVTSGFNLDDPGIPCDAYTPHVGVPNVFSPNGDGQNDVLYVRGEGISKLDFVIYTRWGEKVFETSNKDIGWDGTFHGKELDPAVFIYYLRATLINHEEVNLNGDITLIK